MFDFLHSMCKLADTMLPLVRCPLAFRNSTPWLPPGVPRVNNPRLRINLAVWNVKEVYQYFFALLKRVTFRRCGVSNVQKGFVSCARVFSSKSRSLLSLNVTLCGQKLCISNISHRQILRSLSPRFFAPCACMNESRSSRYFANMHTALG